MKVSTSTDLSSFIHFVISETTADEALENPEILIFCNGSCLQQFSYNADTFTITQINSLHKVTLVVDAGHNQIRQQLRKLWFQPGNAPGIVLAFYDLLTEGPVSSSDDIGNIEALSQTLHLVARACQAKTLSPRAIVVNAPRSDSVLGLHEDARYVAPKVLNLLSKWVTLESV